MNEYIELLNEKNHFLKKFYLLNLNELERFSQGNFETVEHFYFQREKIIDILVYITNKIEFTEDRLLTKQNILTKETQHQKQQMEVLVNDILKQDMDILSLIEAAKSSIILELQKIKTGKKVISNYKSPQTIKRKTHGRDSESSMD